MRYPKHHKVAARAQLLQQCGSHAKQHGYAASGMAALAASAGVTTGALYKHFDGKADLFSALIATELARTAQLYADVDAQDGAAVRKALAGYLSVQHARHPERGCPLPLLTSEVARADDATRAAYEAGVLDIHALLQRFTGSADRAWTLLAQNVGALMIAGALQDERLQKKLLAAVRKAGEALLANAAASDSAACEARGSSVR